MVLSLAIPGRTDFLPPENPANSCGSTFPTDILRSASKTALETSMGVPIGGLSKIDELPCVIGIMAYDAEPVEVLLPHDVADLIGCCRPVNPRGNDDRDVAFTDTGS